MDAAAGHKSAQEGGKPKRGWYRLIFKFPVTSSWLPPIVKLIVSGFSSSTGTIKCVRLTVAEEMSSQEWHTIKDGFHSGKYMPYGTQCMYMYISVVVKIKNVIFIYF